MRLVVNKLILGDCYEKLKKLDTDSVDLIYLDPPFFTQQKQQLTKINTNKEFQKYEFEDSWSTLNEYLDFMKSRLVECRRILKDTGSIFLHCDRNASHHLRVLMDQIFGDSNFRSEIIWSYRRWSNAKKGLLNSHQNIYFYSKTDKFKFNTLYSNYSLTTNVDQILQNRKKDNNGITTYQTDEDGNVVNNFDKKGVPLSDVWEIPYLNPKAKERNGYPTQKPILLLEQIIKISSDEGDLVLDPFCGSGTTLAAAKLLNRNYIGIDISQDAINLCKERLDSKLIKTNSRLLEKGISTYNEKAATELVLLNSLNAVVVQRNSGIDGIIPNKESKKVIAIKIQKETESLEECIEKLNKACSLRKIQNKLLIRNMNSKYSSLFEKDIVTNNKDVKIVDSYLDIIKKEIDINF